MAKCKYKANECERFTFSAPKIVFIFCSSKIAYFAQPGSHISEAGHKITSGNGPSSLNLSDKCNLMSDGIFQYIYCIFHSYNVIFVKCLKHLFSIRVNIK